MTGPETLRAARSRAAWMRERLADLVRCESPSDDIPALEACAGLIAGIGAEMLGGSAQRPDPGGRPCLLWPGTGPDQVLVLGHFDTVWPAGTLAGWPYSVTVDNAAGPGVFDMKAGIIQAIAAVGLLDDPSPVTVLLTSDEETGSGASRELIERQASQARAVLVCEPSADGGALKIARKGIAVYQLTVTGRAAHAGLEPHLGINAGTELASQVLALADLADPRQETTVTPTLMTAGTTVNTVPEHATVTVDVRAWTTAELERVDHQIRLATARTPGAAVAVTGGINRPPFHPGAARDLLALAREAAAELGQAPPGAVRSAGGSDGNLTAALGVPTLDGLGAIGGHPHSRAEHASLGAMPSRAALLSALISHITMNPAAVAAHGESR